MEIVVTNQYGLIIFAVTVDENGMPKTLYQGINRAEAVSTYQKAIENPANAKKRVRFYNFRQVYDYVGAEKDKSAYPIKEFYDDTEIYQPSNKDNIETIMVNNNHKLLAPNGKVSNLTAEQWHLVRTPEFKDWFGDWLRHPNRSSKVLDANGEPMVMFHGSNNYQYFTNPYPNYTVFFDPRMSRLEPRTEGGGVYFSNKWDVAAQFSIFNFVVECFINIRKPIKIDGDHSHIWYVIGEERINYGKNDGVILYNTFDTLDGETENENYVSDIVIARYSNQIKLADGRNTTFDKNDVDIRFEDGGKLHSSNIHEGKKLQKKHDAEILFDKKLNKYIKSVFLSDDEPIRTWKNMKIGDKITVTNIYRDLPESQADPDMGEYELKVIPIALTDHYINGYVHNRDYFREDDYDNYQTELLNRLKNDFDSNKRQPIIAIYNRYGYYTVVDGHHRLVIANELGRKSILALVIDETDLFQSERVSSELPAYESYQLANQLYYRGYQKEIQKDRIDWMQNLLQFKPNNNYEDGGKTDTLLAPNGKPSNLTPEQWHLVRTPAFKAWFGDWENSPETASKVVDSNGEPLVVYHATHEKGVNNFYVFSELKGKLNFTESKMSAEFFYENWRNENKKNNIRLVSVFLNVKKIFDVYRLNVQDIEKLIHLINTQKEFMEQWYFRDFDSEYESVYKKTDIRYLIDFFNNYAESWNLIEDDFFQNFLIQNKYDGFTATEMGFEGKTYGVYLPNQIKLADGTNTTFDGNNPDIRYADGGKIKNYLHNIHKINTENGYETYYRANFGDNGTISWSVDENEDYVSSTLHVWDIQRNSDEPIGKEKARTAEGKKGSKGEGSKAVASLFLLYPNVEEIIYDDDSAFDDDTSFWQRIGGDVDVLTRESFFDYYNAKFGNNPDTSYADGGKIDYSKDITVVAALTNSNNEVLILQRGATAGWMPLHWSLVGGMVDEGEDKKKAVLREIKEEIGIDIADVDYVDTIYTKDAGTIVYYVGKLPDDAEIVLDYENVRYDYINSDTINNYDYVPYVKSFIHKLLFEMYRKNHVVKYALYSKITGLPTKNVAPTDFVRSMNNLQSFCVANGLANRIFKGSGGYYVLRHDGTLIKAFDTLNNITYEDAYKLLVRNYEHGGKFHLVGNMSKHLAPNGKPSNLTPEQWHLVRTPAFKAWFGDWENNPQEASKVVDENGEPLVVYHGTLTGGFYEFNMGRISDEDWDDIWSNEFRSGADPTAYLGSHFALEKEVAEMFLKRKYSHIGYNPMLYECFLNIRNMLKTAEVPMTEKLLEQNAVDAFAIEREIEFDDIDYLQDEYGTTDTDKLYEMYNSDVVLRKTINQNALQSYSSDAIALAAELADKYRYKLLNEGIHGIEYSNLIEGGTSYIVFYPEQIKLADGTNTTFDGNNPDIRFELGGIYHGSPYRFEKFSTSHIGTGESHRSYGWGLYFTEIEEIAKFYANNVSRPILLDKNANEIKISDELANLIKLGYEKNMMWWDTDYIKEIMGIRAKALGTKWAEDAVKELNQIGYFELVFDRYVYCVTLHKGKTPDQYTWLEWDKPVSAENIIKINKALEKKGIPATPKKYMEVGMDGRVSVGMNGEQVYIELSKIFVDAEFGGDKQASLFLLENGIDGIKYPADKNMAGGFSYVVFDENAVTIENVEQFEKGGKTNSSRPYSSLDISRVKKGIVHIDRVHPKRITKIDDLPI